MAAADFADETAAGSDLTGLDVAKAVARRWRGVNAVGAPDPRLLPVRCFSAATAKPAAAKKNANPKASILLMTLLLEM
jgi:hypothetical protein